MSIDMSVTTPRVIAMKALHMALRDMMKEYGQAQSKDRKRLAEAIDLVSAACDWLRATTQHD